MGREQWCRNHGGSGGLEPPNIFSGSCVENQWVWQRLRVFYTCVWSPPLSKHLPTLLGRERERDGCKCEVCGMLGMWDRNAQLPLSHSLSLCIVGKVPTQANQPLNPYMVISLLTENAVICMY